VKPPSDIELKQVIAGDYARNAQRAGATPDMGAIERQVLADLAMVDQYEAEQAAKPKPVRVAKERDIRTDELDTELAKTGMRAYVKDDPQERQGDMILDATPKSERAIRMFGRVKQILRPRGDIGAVARKGGDLRDCTIECTDPALSLEFLELWTWYGPLRALPSPKNKFFYMTDTDAAAAFIRGLEDICDRSTGKFGPWWVK
jgi:hypothetical protein